MEGLVFGFGVATLMCVVAIVAGAAEGIADWLAWREHQRVVVTVRPRSRKSDRKRKV